MREKLIIIGNGAAGNSALEEILSHSHNFDVTVVTSEATPIYYRPMLSEYISEPAIPKRFYLHDDNWYSSHNVKIMYNTNVNAIDANNQDITLEDSTVLHYDKLIITSGSKNFIPPLPGADKQNVLNLRTLSDAETIKQKASASKRAVIIGGGLLGLELGWQLRKLNIEVTVLEMMQRLLPRQLDEEASELFEQKVAATGIKVLKGVQTHEIYGDQSAAGVKLVSGDMIDGDMVIFSIGIRADVQLAKTCNLKVERGIVVNDFMETSEKNIFAAGDCVEYAGVNYAIWPEAVEQGKVAGLNALGIRTVYEPVVPFNIYNGMNMRLFSIGDVGSNPANQYTVKKHGDSESFEKYFFVNNRLVGGILLGNISKSGHLKKAVISGAPISEFDR